MQPVPSLNLKFNPRAMTLAWDCSVNATAVRCVMVHPEKGLVAVKVGGAWDAPQWPVAWPSPGQREPDCRHKWETRTSAWGRKKTQGQGCGDPSPRFILGPDAQVTCLIPTQKGVQLIGSQGRGPSIELW